LDVQEKYDVTFASLDYSFRLPSGSCDAHCHVFGPSDRFPYSATRRYDPADTPKETLGRLHERLGIDRAVIVQASAHGTDNRAMLDALAWRPNEYRGVAIIDDSFDDATLLRMHEAGVRGARFNFVASLGGYPDPAVFAAVTKRIAALGWHVVLHLKGADLLALEDTIRALPLPFVIDHMGRVDVALGLEQPAFALLIELMKDDRAWVKVSGAERMAKYPYDAALPFAQALVVARPDRVLWGTDFPHPNLSDPVEENDLVAMIPRVAGDSAARHRLLVDNPARLYGFAA
jgi:2-pyrone-4,6-dicarboxylate lactonase